MEVNESKAGAAALGYTVGNIILKGIVFLTLPIFTRLLSLSDFGLYNNYIAYEGMISAILGLGFYSTIKKAVYEFKNNFDAYFSTIITLNLCFFLVSVVFSLIFSTGIEEITGFNIKIIIVLLSQSFGSMLVQIYSSYLNSCFKYKEYLALSFFNLIVNISLSIVLIVFVFPNEKYMGRIIGSAVPYLISGAYLLTLIYIRGRRVWNKKYIFFAIKMGVPLIPHVLGQFVLNQSDRIIITSLSGANNSGLYSYAYNISIILLIVYQSIDAAWTPWLYAKIEKGEVNTIKESQKKYIVLGTILFLGFICLAPDIFKIMAERDYWDGINMIVPLALSHYFLFMYYIPVNLEYYHKKTLFVSIGTIGCAVLNIVLNYLLIPRLGYHIAAYTTLISYQILFLVHTLISLNFQLKNFYSTKHMLYSSIVVSVSGILFAIAQSNQIIDYVVRYSVLVTVLVFCYKYFKSELRSFFKKAVK